MERSREARRGTIPATANGLSRRRQRNSSLRDSPEKDGGVLELQEMVKLRGRASKKNENRSSRSKRRRGERLLHGSNREDGSEESSEESLDDEEDEEDEDTVVSAASAVRLLPMNPVALTPVSSMPSHHHQQWKSFPPKVVRAVGPPWKAADEMIGVSVPRKARSASAKRSHECWISGGNGSGGGGSGERVLQQASMSPARPSTTPVVPAAPISPSSSNASGQKKMKPVGAKHKPPKISKTISSSSIQEIEIEVAEVLYGLTRQFQCPSKQETISSPSHKLDSKDVNGSGNDAKSRGSSPVSASPPEAPYPSVLLQNSSSTTVPSSDVAKRKRLRPVKFEEESPTVSVDPYAFISSAAKVEIERLDEVENSLVAERSTASAVENGGESSNLGSSQVHLQQDPVKPESDPVPDSKPSVAESDGQEGIETKEEISSPVKETPCAKLDVNLDDARAAKADSTACAVESLCEEKFKFDLMVPPSAKSSPERDGAPGFTIHQKPSAPEVDMAPKMGIIKIEEEKADGIVKQGAGEGGSEEKKAEAMVEVVELQKQMPKERILGLQPDAEMQDKDGISSSKQQILKQHQSKATRIEPKAARAGNSTDGKSQAASLQLPMTVPGWPGSLPLGYMGQVPSIQAPVSVDRGSGSSTTIQPPQFAPLQPRPKRCATHFYIAKKINYHRQFAPTNPFWPSAAGNAALYGAKPYNINTVTPTESALLLNPLQGSFVARNLSPLQDKGPACALAAQALKEKSSTATITDSAQRKQLMLQQVPQPTSANNLLQAPAFIFPMSQQQAPDAAATQSGIVKSAATISYASPLSGSTNSFAGLVGSSGSAAPATMSFNYGSLPPNDAQYLAILQSNGYPFPIPAPVGAPLPYNGSHAQAVPFFNGSFYSSQMLHPSQLQQQQHPQAQPPIQQGHQNTKTLSSSSSSQKHKQQQQIQGCSSNGWGGSSHSFPALKQRHSQLRNQQVPPHQAQQLDNAVSGKDSTSTSDSRIPHASKNASNHNFAMLSMHPQNFSLMSPVGLGVVNQGGEKQQQQQHQNIRGMELTPSQAFAMSFASFNGTAAAPSVDFSSIAQSYPVFQSLPEAARHGYQMAAAAAAAQAQQKNNQNIEEGRAANDSTHPNASGEEDKKALAGKASAAMISHSLAFSRPESDLPISTVLGNGAVNSSAGTLNIITAHTNGNHASSRASSMTTPTATVTTVSNAPNPTHQQQQQLIQLQKQQQQQQQQLQLAARAKPFATNNANVYSDCLPSSVMAMSQNNVSVFPQALIQGSISHSQSPQWKNSTRSGTTPIQSPSTTQVQSVKNLPQQGRVQVRGLQATNHTQISFGVNPKVVPSAQQLPATNPSTPSAGIVVGSPSTSISKSAGGSPRTSTGSKAIPSPTAATLPSQPAKNPQSSSSRKSSPMGGPNVPSILSNSQVTSTQSSSVKPQQQQQQLQNKPPFQQSQLLFSNAYVQA